MKCVQSIRYTVPVCAWGEGGLCVCERGIVCVCGGIVCGGGCVWMCVWGGLCVNVCVGGIVCGCVDGMCMHNVCVCVCVRKYNIRGSPISKVAGTQHSAWKVPPVLDFPLRKHATDIQCMNTHTHTQHTHTLLHFPWSA